MKILAIIPTNGIGPYPIAQDNTGHIYVSTRGSKSIDVISHQKLQLIKTIPLPDYPRSVTCNKVKNLCIVSGRTRPITSLFSTINFKVVATVGEDTITTPTDFGGSHATGHPFWVTPEKFLILDRANRKMGLYSVSERNGEFKVKLSDSLQTNTAIHHVLAVPDAKDQDKKLFYAIAEGAPNEHISPALVEFELSGTKLAPGKTLNMPTNNVEVEEMGSHHASFHPDGIHIYLGSNEGFTYVIDRNSMSVNKTIKTGKGNGHTTMCPHRMIGVSTNHNDEFMTIINLKTHERIKDIKVSNLATNPKRKTQAHTSSGDPIKGLFYTAASDEGRIMEIDINTYSISREISLEDGSYPIQGTFIWPGENGAGGMK